MMSGVFVRGCDLPVGVNGKRKHDIKADSPLPADGAARMSENFRRKTNGCIENHCR